MKGLILSGGYGSRLRPITHTTQKQLIPIANKPIIFYVIEDLVEVGIKDIGIVVGPNREQVRSVVGDGSLWQARITYIPQDEPKGLAHCVKISTDLLKDDRFVMYLGDNLLKGGIGKFVESFDGDASILLTPVDNPSQFGVATLNPDGSVRELVEKPKAPQSNLALVGIYAFGPKIFQAVEQIKPSFRDELEITDAIQWLIENGYKVQSSKVTGWWKDTGKPEDLLEGNQLVLDELETDIRGEIDASATIRGRVAVGEGTRVEGQSVIRGPVIIGSDSVIRSSYIGPYTAIGNRVKLTDTEIEHSIVLDECNICAATRIVDSLLGQNCQIVSSENSLPSGHRLVIGDNSAVEL